MMNLSSDAAVAEQQMRAIIFCLVAFGYIDGEFAASEKALITLQLGDMARRRAASGTPDVDGQTRDEAQWRQRYERVLEQYDDIIRGHFTESVAQGETTQQWVISKLKVGCFEVLRHFDFERQRTILDAVDELMMADGVEHPEERAFRDELLTLMAQPATVEATIQPDADARASADTQADLGGAVTSEFASAATQTFDETQDAYTSTPSEAFVSGKATEPSLHPPAMPVLMCDPAELPLVADDHPFFAGFEWPFAQDAVTFARQISSEMQLVAATKELFARGRQAGAGRLAQAQKLSDLAGQEPFLDGFTYVVPPMPGRRYRLLVVGDLHGCYSCLKAALLQGDFFGMVERYRRNPTVEPKPYLVLLGDYIDRGHFSFSGTLRAVMQLLVRMPEHVFALRGNHEHYVEINNQVVAPVRPCEAMDEIIDVATNEVFVQYMELFEALPTVLLFDTLFFVHGGIPRSDTTQDRWRHLGTLNDAVLRFEMMWSDPSDVDSVPLELQQETARFAFGREQFYDFMELVGCHTLIRGHERVPAGYYHNYEDPRGVLITLFSAGGANNLDLPVDSNYREVAPAALIIDVADGHHRITPYYLDYEAFNQPQRNAFHAVPLVAGPRTPQPSRDPATAMTEVSG